MGRRLMIGIITVTLMALAPVPAAAGDELTITAGGVVVSPEGDVGSSVWDLPVTLSASAADVVTVEWETESVGATNGFADPDSDYVANSGTATFLPGETVQTVQIEILGDSTDEPPFVYGEWGFVFFTNPTNATLDMSIGVFIIIDDDPPPLITPGVAAVTEGDTGQVIVEVPVTLSNPSATEITIDWTTADTGGLGIATADVDYLADSGTTTFAAGETTHPVPITVLGDTIDEPPALFGEWGLIAFSNPSPNATLDTSFYGLGIFIIIDDDPPTG